MLDYTCIKRLTALVAVAREGKKNLTRFELLELVAFVDHLQIEDNKPIFGFKYTASPLGPLPTTLYISMIEDAELFNDHLKIKECSNGVHLIENKTSLEELEFSRKLIDHFREKVSTWRHLKEKAEEKRFAESPKESLPNKLAV